MTDDRSKCTFYGPGMGNPLDARSQERDRPMSAAQQTRDHRRFRLATNDNEIIVEDNKMIAEGELDTEAHRLAGNDNETIVDGLRRVDPTDGDDDLAPLSARRLRR